MSAISGAATAVLVVTGRGSVNVLGGAFARGSNVQFGPHLEELEKLGARKQPNHAAAVDDW